MIAAGEFAAVVNLNRQHARATGAGVESQSGIRRAAACDDEHDRPIDMTEDPFKGRFIGSAGPRAIAGMRVNPDATKLFWLSTLIDLRIEEVSDGFIVEFDMRPRAVLADELNIVDEQQVVRAGDAEAADFGFAQVTQEQQLRPRCR